MRRAGLILLLPVAAMAAPGTSPVASDVDLPKGAVARLGESRFFANAAPKAVAFSRDGALLASAVPGSTSVVHLWDVATGKLARTIVLPKGRKTQNILMSFVGGGEPAVADGAGTVLLFDVGGQVARRVEFTTPQVLETVFSADGRHVAYRQRDSKTNVEKAAVVELASGKQLTELVGVVALLGVRGEGEMVCVRGDARTSRCEIVLHSAARPAPPPEPVKANPKPKAPKPAATATPGAPAIKLDVPIMVGMHVNAALSGDGNMVVIEPEGMSATLVWLDGGRRVLLGEARGSGGWMFSPDGSLLAGAGSRGRLTVWDTRTGKPLAAPSLRTGAACAAFSPDGKLLAVANSAGGIRLWDFAAGGFRPAGTGHADGVTAVAVSPDGRTVATGGRDGIARVWPAGGGQSRVLGEAGDAVAALAFSRRGELAAAREPGTLELWDASTARRAWVDPNTGMRSVVLAFDANGLRLRAADTAGKYGVWDAASGKRVETLLAAAMFGGRPAFIPGADKLCWASRDVLNVLDVKRGTRFSMGDTAGPKRQLGSALNVGPWCDVAATTRDGTAVVLCDLHSGKTFELHRAQDKPSPGWREVMFSPNERIVAAVGGRGAVDFIAVPTGELLGQVSHGTAVLSACWSGDGKRFVTGGVDGTTLVWEVPGAAREPSPAAVTTRPADGADLTAMWDDLAGDDAGKAFRAVLGLAAGGDRAVELVRRNAKVPGAGWAEDIRRLVAGLSANTYNQRQKSHEELRKLGPNALAALEEALRKPESLEARVRLEGIVEALRKSGEASGEELRSLRAVSVLERAGGPAAETVLRSIAAGVDGLRVTDAAKAALTRMKKE